MAATVYSSAYQLYMLSLSTANLSEYYDSVSVTCNSEIKENNTYFRNPGFPDPYDNEGICPLLYKKKDPQICQLRLDFDLFRLIGTTSGSCSHDSFHISGQNTNNVVPELCGVNDGQHLYVEVSDTEEVKVSVVTSGRGNRRWEIKISVIECDAPLRSPSYCLQYHSGSTGTIESFNYRTAGALAAGGSGYQNLLNYDICIRKERGFCSVVYSNEDPTTGRGNVFQIVNVNPVPGFQPVPTLNPNQAGADIKDCPGDFLFLSKGLRLCGVRLNDASQVIDRTVNSPVSDEAHGPFVAMFQTDSKLTGRGFQLFYRQVPCHT